MKGKITKEYKRRVRKVLETKLNGENMIKGINTWAVSLIRYSAAFLDWTKEEKQSIDRVQIETNSFHDSKYVGNFSEHRDFYGFLMDVPRNRRIFAKCVRDFCYLSEVPLNGTTLHHGLFYQKS